MGTTQARTLPEPGNIAPFQLSSVKVPTVWVLPVTPMTSPFYNDRVGGGPGEILTDNRQATEFASARGTTKADVAVAAQHIRERAYSQGRKEAGATPASSLPCGANAVGGQVSGPRHDGTPLNARPE